MYIIDFNPRSPCGERLRPHRFRSALEAFQSTLPVRGATGSSPNCSFIQFISIHAPRAGSDAGKFDIDLTMLYFNPRSPCGERQRGVYNRIAPLVISIHAPRAGSDVPESIDYIPLDHFNPRSPCGERRIYLPCILLRHRISIHAPRAGSDLAGLSVTTTRKYFNPRSPCGERPPNANI